MQDETRNIQVLGFDVSYIRGLTVNHVSNRVHSKHIDGRCRIPDISDPYRYRSWTCELSSSFNNLLQRCSNWIYQFKSSKFITTGNSTTLKTHNHHDANFETGLTLLFWTLTHEFFEIPNLRFEFVYAQSHTETQMSSFWRHFRHWLQCNAAIKMTTFNAASDGNFNKMTTFPLQWISYTCWSRFIVFCCSVEPVYFTGTLLFHAIVPVDTST